MTQIPQIVRVAKTICSASQPRPGHRALTREDIYSGHSSRPRTWRAGPEIRTPSVLCPAPSPAACPYPDATVSTRVPCAALPVPASCGPISGTGLLPVAVSLTHICLSWSLVSLVGCLVGLFVLSKALKPHSLPKFSYLISINSGTRKGFYLRRTIDI